MRNPNLLATESEKGARASATEEPTSFERQIKPLFREGDRQSMKWAFDLWSHDDVARNSDAILARLRAGTTPLPLSTRPSGSRGRRSSAFVHRDAE
jgi:hypothetical protein